MSAVAAAALSTTAAHTPFRGVSTQDLETELLGLAGHIAAAQCRFLQLLAEFDRRGGWAGAGVRSCAHWLSWRIGMSLRTAVEQLRVAHALERLPRITDAFAAGRISYSKVRAITRIAGDGDITSDGNAPLADSAARHDVDQPDADQPGDEISEDVAGDNTAGGADEVTADEPPVPDPATAEQTLLDLALSGTASHVETVVRAVRRRRTAPTEHAARRSLSWYWADDGSLVLRGRFAPEEGAALIAAVDELVPSREPVRHPVPDAPQDWGERAVEQAPGVVVDRRAARRADALVALVSGEARPETTDGQDLPVVSRGRTQVVLHLGVGSGGARIDGGPEVPVGTAERLACDARVQLLLDDRTRNRLHLGRSRRLATPAQIAALTARDGARCQFPGCAHTRHLHAHHVRHWLHGGRTDVDNLILVCSYHHGVVHDHGYLIHRRPCGWEIRRPDGSAVPATAAPLDGNVEGLIEVAARQDLRITRNSLTPTWAGERLDPAPILDALLPRRVAEAA